MVSYIRDCVRRKVQYKLTQSTMRRGSKSHAALRGDVKESVTVKPGRICLAYATV